MWPKFWSPLQLSLTHQPQTVMSISSMTLKKKVMKFYSEIIVLYFRSCVLTLLNNTKFSVVACSYLWGKWQAWLYASYWLWVSYIKLIYLIPLVRLCHYYTYRLLLYIQLAIFNVSLNSFSLNFSNFSIFFNCLNFISVQLSFVSVLSILR